MYHIKQQPGDFIVREKTNISPLPTGEYCYFKLTKKSRNTIDAIKSIARRLHLPEKYIGFAGNKDKHAITEQYCSIKSIYAEKLKIIQLNDLSLDIVGYGNKPISLGDLLGNEFTIVVRNLTKVKVNRIHYLVNYFDEQRFSLQNVDIGRHLLHKQFKEALMLIQKKECEEHLEQHQNDYVGALKKLSPRLLRMYVNAYQSYIWNETVSFYLRSKGKKFQETPYSLGKLIFIEPEEQLLSLRIPLIGFDEKEMPKEIKEIIQEIMHREHLTTANFIIKQIPELTMEGELRKVFVPIDHLDIGTEEDDEFNPGKKKVTVSFFLPKGSYATMAIRMMFAEVE